ncbi:hypothetical protein PG995_005320 [Apiospora arundinis]
MFKLFRLHPLSALGRGFSTSANNNPGGFHLSRPQTVKKIWDYIKSHNLQDPADKRYIRCDKAMRSVFSTERLHMFTMNKILSEHLKEGRKA